MPVEPHKTLGRRADLRALAHHDLLNVPDWRWTRALNRSWIQEGVRARQPFLVVSRGDLRGTVLEWELVLLREAGYRPEGLWWRPR